VRAGPGNTAWAIIAKATNSALPSSRLSMPPFA